MSFNFNGIEERLYPVIVQNGTETLLVDLGYVGFFPLIENAAQQEGISLQIVIDEMVCYHGGVIRGNIQYELSRLIAKYNFN